MPEKEQGTVMRDGDPIGYYHDCTTPAKEEEESPFTWNSLEDFARWVCAECVDLAARKNEDYTGESADRDPFTNLRRGGPYGIAVRMDDKVSRLMALLRKELRVGNPVASQVVNESIEDTAKDLLNYAWLLMGLREDLRRRERRDGSRGR